MGETKENNWVRKKNGEILYQEQRKWETKMHGQINRRIETTIWYTYLRSSSIILTLCLLWVESLI